MNIELISDTSETRKVKALGISLEIENLMSRDVDPLDAILHVAEIYQIQVEDLPNILHYNVIEKLSEYLLERRMIKGGRKPKIPFDL